MPETCEAKLTNYVWENEQTISASDSDVSLHPLYFIQVSATRTLWGENIPMRFQSHSRRCSREECTSYAVHPSAVWLWAVAVRCVGSVVSEGAAVWALRSDKLSLCEAGPQQEVEQGRVLLKWSPTHTPILVSEKKEEKKTGSCLEHVAISI